MGKSIKFVRFNETLPQKLFTLHFSLRASVELQPTEKQPVGQLLSCGIAVPCFSWLEPQVERMHTPYLSDAHADLLPAVLCLHVDLAQKATVEAVGQHHDLSFSVSLKA